MFAILAKEPVKHALAAVLNSDVVDFYHKQQSRIHRGKAYSYIEDYTSKWPVTLGNENQQAELKQLVEQILDLKNLEIKIPQFPDPYIADARESGKEFVPLTYTPSSSYVASPSLDSDLSGGYTITLQDGGINSSDINSRIKADYVMEAIDGRSLSSNQSVTIPVPFDGDVAESALDELEADRDTLELGSIREIESNINEIVFDLYGIESERHQEMIRRFNRQHDESENIDPSF